ncbi:NAD(P)-dependent oxidoreductase [Actinocorallia populi]|uniref:NAD(P)-dependent oxidoreductase n=1 Tax=Actinocorallia populi TaxID=2079200 RepID=UPI000D08FA7F|nr:NAD(P)-dependent oxidoreductase [Actinocorallia populi]
MTTTVGFVGLGNMGGALAANVVRHGLPLVAYDAAGPERVPEGAVAAGSVAEVARETGVVVLSLPDGRTSGQVIREIAAVEGLAVTHVIDTSTIGVAAAEVNAALLAAHGVSYVDAPVSGGPAGARARTLAVMYSGTDEACAGAEPVLAALTDRLHRVGDRAGPAQALKLANNFLAATALAATSEAVAFGVAAGLDMGTMLEVLNASSGRNSATGDKFPNHVLTGTYAAGFGNTLMAKDVRLYLDAVAERGGATEMGEAVTSLWERFAKSEPGTDFTRIYPFIDRS